MLKKFLSHWQYGITTRVVDGALIANVDTAIEPTFVRLELSKIASATLTVQNRDSDYELVFVHNRAEQTAVAKFEVREAALVARENIACALMAGERARRFKGAYGATLGVAAGVLTLVIVGTIVASLMGATGVSPAEGIAPALTHSLTPTMVPDTMPSAPPAPTAGEPMSADDFLNRAN
jgi:hypothetical protein